MREEFGDIWEMGERPNSVVCITTSGALNTRGECVMGKGIARQARDRFPGLAKELGDEIRAEGNHVHWLSEDLLSFPTKHVWWQPSGLGLIHQSAWELKLIAIDCPNDTFYLPR